MKIPIFLVLLVSSFVSNGQRVQVKSGWTATVSSLEIVEAGLDYSGTITSDPDQTTINFNGGKLPNSYYITVQKNDNGLDAGLSLWVRRTGDGNGSPFATVSGGTTFMQVTDSGEILYSGVNRNGGTRRHVPIQYQFRGVSVLQPVKTYSINVIYTISE